MWDGGRLPTQVEWVSAATKQGTADTPWGVALEDPIVAPPVYRANTIAGPGQDAPPANGNGGQRAAWSLVCGWYSNALWPSLKDSCTDKGDVSRGLFSSAA